MSEKEPQRIMGGTTMLYPAPQPTAEPQEDDLCGGHCGRCDETHTDWELRIQTLKAENATLRQQLDEARKLLDAAESELICVQESPTKELCQSGEGRRIINAIRALLEPQKETRE